MKEIGVRKNSNRLIVVCGGGEPSRKNGCTYKVIEKQQKHSLNLSPLLQCLPIFQFGSQLKMTKILRIR
jgi:hypothetical protein